jgi:hypothetical protein
MSDYSGTIKHAVHVSCKSRIHTSCVASPEGIKRVPLVRRQRTWAENDGRSPTIALA